MKKIDRYNTRKDTGIKTMYKPIIVSEPELDRLENTVEELVGMLVEMVNDYEKTRQYDPMDTYPNMPHPAIKRLENLLGKPWSEIKEEKA